VTALMEKSSVRALADAMAASRAAELLAGAQGNWRLVDENRIRQTELRQRLKQSERRGSEAIDLVLGVLRDYQARSLHAFAASGDPQAMLDELARKDSFIALAIGAHPSINVEQFRAGWILREHVRGLNGGSRDYVERVDGGFLRNDCMEGLIDRRRPLRYALNAAAEAIEDRALARGAILVIIDGISLRKACAESGISHGKGQKRIKMAVGEALDAAAAHIGIAA
jgi:hypothetical protein